MQNDLYLSKASILCPLGAEVAMVNTAINAGLNSFEDINIFDDEEQTLKFSFVPTGALKIPLSLRLPGLTRPQIRLLNIAAFSLMDLAPHLPNTSVPLFLAGPQSYYPANGVNSVFLRHLSAASGIKFDAPNSRYFALGRAGVLEAIARAFRYFEQTDAAFALVGGLDTYYDIRTLGLLRERARLANMDQSIDGFIPGEGAGFLLLSTDKAPAVYTNSSPARLAMPALRQEPGHLLSTMPYTGEAMANAVQSALAGRSARPCRVYSSENGEMHYTKEMTVTHIRCQDALAEDTRIIRPAENFGDLGAAFAAIVIAIAGEQAKSRFGSSLICASSDGGLRGAMQVIEN